MAALLESPDRVNNFENNFWAAYDALSMHNDALIKDGLALSIKLEQATVVQGMRMIENKRITLVRAAACWSKLNEGKGGGG